MHWAPESDAQRDEIQRLARQLMDQDAGVRQNALDALKAMGPQPMCALPTFVQILNKQFLFSKEKCSRALDLIGPDVIEAMWSLVPADQVAKIRPKAYRADAAKLLERFRTDLS